MENFKIFKIHISYIIGFLITMIIGLITIKWNNIPNLVDYITFALTLSSLVLSLLAIIYSFVSNNKFSESIGALNNVSDEVLDSSKKLNLITDDLSIKVAEIPEHLKNVEEKAEKTHQLIESMKIEKENTSVSTSEVEGVAKHEFSVDKFLSVSSFNGKALLYALSLSFNQKKSFLLQDIFDSNRDYVWGYFIATSSMGLIEYTETQKVILVTNLNPIIDKRIKDIAFTAARKYDDNQKPEDLVNFSWVSKLENIELYFNNKL